MAGLLEKDVRLIMQRKQILLLFVVIAVVLGFSQDGTFILGYLSFCASIVMVSTISYDELDHGYEFLMTLPITAKIYVNMLRRNICFVLVVRLLHGCLLLFFTLYPR